MAEGVFTGERVRAAAACLRRRWRFDLLVLGALAAVAVSAWFLLSPWTSRPTYQTLAVAELGEETLVVALGSSHVHVTIDPELIGVPFTNLSGDACNHVAMEAVLAGNVRRVPNLRAVLLELDIVPLTYDTIDVYQGDYRRLLDLQPDLDVLAEPPARKLALRWQAALTRSALLGPFLARDKLAPVSVAERRKGPSEPLLPGRRRFTSVMTPERDGAARLAVHAREGSLANVPKNRAALARTIAFLLERGIHPVLVRLPHHESYWSARPASWDDAYERTLSELRARFGDALAVWDLERLPGLRDEHFFDGDHLNQAGAVLLAAELDARLAALLDRDTTVR